MSLPRPVQGELYLFTPLLHRTACVRYSTGKAGPTHGDVKRAILHVLRAASRTSANNGCLTHDAVEAIKIKSCAVTLVLRSSVTKLP